MDTNFLAVIFVICLFFIIITLLLGRSRKKILKYIPLMVSAAAAAALFIKAYFFSEMSGFEALGYFILMLVAIGAAAVSLLTALIIEIVRYMKRKKQ